MSASAYYQRASGQRSARRVEDERLLARIREVHAANSYVVEYLGWFNHTRPHQAIGDLPPAEFEAQALPAQAAPEPGEGQTFNGRRLRRPVPSEILTS